MKFTHAHRFDASVDDVIRMLSSERFAYARAKASGAQQADAIVDGDPDTEFTVSIRRVMSATTIPSEFRSLVGNQLDVKYTEAWEAPGNAERVGTFALDIAGTPGRVTGALELKADGDGTVFFAAGNTSAPVPLVGAMIERAVTEAVVAGFEAELEAADAWLAQKK